MAPSAVHWTHYHSAQNSGDVTGTLYYNLIILITTEYNIRVPNLILMNR